MLTLPETPQEFDRSLRQFQARLLETKRTSPPPAPGWYPFDSFAGLQIGLKLIEPVYPEFTAEISGKPVADIGCGDGDLSLLFASWGASVRAIDYPPTNYNRMQGIERLAQLTGLPVTPHAMNLDGRFQLPGKYGFTLFLGLLYHLQNPYYALERLAFHTDWCLLSTRVAQVTTPAGVRLADEPVAYLASGIEIDNDATNYWIFSLTGLLRIVQRTRWAVRGVHRAGCLANSNPSEKSADERVFLLLQSRVSYPNLQVRLGRGWYASEGRNFTWTAKLFTLHLVLPLEQHFSGFSLDIYIPEAALPWIKLEAYISGQLCGQAAYSAEGIQPFSGILKPLALHEPMLVIEFRVTSALQHSGRELGICVPLENDAVPLRVH